MIVCINAIVISEYATLNLHSGISAVESCIKSLLSLSASKYIVLTTHSAANSPISFPPEWEIVTQPKWTLKEAFNFVYSAHNSHSSDSSDDSSDAVVYLPLEYPCIDVELIQKILRMHTQYVAEFTFADGYPQGITPEIVNATILPSLVRLGKEKELLTSQTMLFDIISRDINSFDVETFLSPVDMRPLRISLRCNTRENYLLCKELFSRKVHTSGDIMNALNDSPQLLRQLPAFVSIEVTLSAMQQVSYSPYLWLSKRPNLPPEMEVESFRSIIDEIASFSPEATIHVSLWGEAALHSRVVDLVSIVQDYALKLIIETSGVGWSREVINKILSSNYTNVVWIVALDTHNPELYQEIRGDGYQEAHDFAHSMLDAVPEYCHVQLTRMQKTEPYLEDFYDYWKKKTNNIIILKYDNYSRRLPDLKVTDTSPINRLPCWHIKRDLSIMIDGTVPMCREDVTLDHVLGNTNKDSLQQIWHRGSQIYHQHIRQDYSAICANCDEYYTYNA